MRPAMHFVAGSLLALSLLAGCKAQGPATPPANNAAARGDQAQGNAAALPSEPAQTPVAPGEVKIASKTQLLDFDYSWPKQAADIPPLDAWLRAQASERQKKATKSASLDFDGDRGSAVPFHARSFSQRWETVADTPALLVMQAHGYTFTGGAHGNVFAATVIWDKAKQRRLPLKAVIDPQAMAKAMHDRFCKALAAERTKKRNGLPEAARPTLAEFNRCVDMTHQELVPVSRDGKAIDTLRVVIMPYAAGPWSEGTYTIDLPMDAAALAAVAPAYRSDFTAA